MHKRQFDQAGSAFGCLAANENILMNLMSAKSLQHVMVAKVSAELAANFGSWTKQLPQLLLAAYRSAQRAIFAAHADMHNGPNAKQAEGKRAEGWPTCSSKAGSSTT